MKKLFLVLIASIIGVNAMMLGMWLGWSDNACIVSMAIVALGTAYALGFFEDDEDIPYARKHKEHNERKAA